MNTVKNYLNLALQKYGTGIPIIVGALAMLIALIHYGFNTPYWDQWEMVGIIQKAHQHIIPFHDMWMQHNEHRIFFPLVVLLSSALITHWNTHAELILNLIFATISISLIFCMTRTRLKRKSLALTWTGLLTLWFFSPVQWENWLWGWQLCWFMAIASILATIFLLDARLNASKYRTQMFILAIITAIVATFSLGNGMIVWIIGLALLVLQQESRKLCAIWSMAGVVSTIAYYYHYSHPADSPSALVFIHQPLNFLRYILAYTGRATTDDLNTSMLVGSILLMSLIPIVYIVWQLRVHITKFSPWLALIVFSLITCLLTAISRVGSGYSQSMSSRYAAISTLYIIGISGLILAIVDAYTKTKLKAMPVILVILVISLPLLFSSYTNGFRGFQQRSLYLKQIAECTKSPDPSKECLELTYPNPKKVRPMLIYLKTNHLAGY
jgi:hypothetical protein